MNLGESFLINLELVTLQTVLWFLPGEDEGEEGAALGAPVAEAAGPVEPAAASVEAVVVAATSLD